MMTDKIEFGERERKDAVASLRRYAEENFPEPLGELATNLLLDYFLEEIAPVVYNRAIGDAQARLQNRLADLPGELFAKEFGYWLRVDAKRKRK